MHLGEELYFVIKLSDLLNSPHPEKCMWFYLITFLLMHLWSHIHKAVVYLSKSFPINFAD